MGNWNVYPGSNADTIWNAQMAVSDAVEYPQFAGNVAAVDTCGCWRAASVSPFNQGYHYNWNAETYLLTGDAAGRAMIELQENVAPPGDGYAGWIAGPFAAALTDPAPALDFDGGGQRGQRSLMLAMRASMSLSSVLGLKNTAFHAGRGMPWG